MVAHESKAAVLALRGTCAGRRFGARPLDVEERVASLAACRASQTACAESSPMLARALLNDDDWEVRMEAARVAGDVTTEQACRAVRGDPCGSPTATGPNVCAAFEWVVPALSAAVRDPSWQVGIAALEGLGNAEPRSSSTVALLADVVLHPPPDDSDGVRMVIFAATALARFGPMAAGATDALGARLTAPREWPAKVPILRALTAIGPGAERALPALYASVTSEDWSVRMNVAMALGAIAPLAPESRMALEALSKDADSLVAAEAHGTLTARGR